MSEAIEVRRLEDGPQVDELYEEILAPSFPEAELCRVGDLHKLVAAGHPTWIAVDQDNRVLGGAVSEWDAQPPVMLLSWLAVRPGLRSGGVGGRLLEAAKAGWREWSPCVV